jgi:ribosomal protein L44E
VLDAYADPCSECRLSERCADLRLACRALVAAHRGEDWEEIPRRPTRALYEFLHPHDPTLYQQPDPPRVHKPAKRPKAEQKPRVHKPQPSKRTQWEARIRAQWIGRTLAGREVVAVERDTRHCVALRLRCDVCGREGTTTPAIAARGTTRVCPCQRGAWVRARSEARAREWLGRTVGTREVVGVERDVRDSVVLRLRCRVCGSEAVYLLSAVVNGIKRLCRCGAR